MHRFQDKMHHLHENMHHFFRKKNIIIWKKCITHSYIEMKHLTAQTERKHG